MYCKQCGSELENNDSFCRYCGTKASKPEQVSTQTLSATPVATPKPNPVQVDNTNNAMPFAITGFVFSLIFALVGLILSAIALNQYKKQTNKDCMGLAIAGIVISIVSILIFSFFIIVFVLAIRSATYYY